jgi:hypothetical protein
MPESIAGTAVWATVVALTFVLPALLRRQAGRAWRRNREGVCGLCGLPLLPSDTPVYVEAFRVCGPCARRLRRRTRLAVGALGMVCALVLVTGVLVVLDVIQKRGEGWGVALFVLGVGGTFLWFLVTLLRKQAAMNATLAARAVDLPFPHPFDD